MKLLLLTCALLGHTPPAVPTVPPDDSDAQGLLWRVSGQGLAQPSYLYGTIHAICADDLLMSDATKRAFAATEQVALEMDMDDPATMLTIRQHLLMDEEKKMSDLLSETDYALVHTFFTDSLGMDLDQLQRMQPMLMAAMLFPKLLSCTPQAYEMVFMEMAQQAQKEVVGVESADDQLAAVGAISYADQAQMLLEMVRDYDTTRSQLHALVTAYQAQNLTPVYEMMRETMPGYEAFEEVFLVRRNRRWIPVMEQMAREKPTFFAVGALHLAGETGVIQLLRTSGYTVEPVLP